MIRLVLVVAAATMLCAAASAQTGRPLLQVRQVMVKGSPLPVEGAIPYIRVVRQDGSKVVQRRLRSARVPYANIRLDPGRYHLLSWQRDCNGNCHLLGPPTDRCARWLRIHRGQRLVGTITVRYGSGCRISWG